MKYKAGKYILQKSPDLFDWQTRNTSHEIIEVMLTESEANNLIGTKLYEKLGFSGWSFLGK
jgi:hypothetical protein